MTELLNAYKHEKQVRQFLSSKHIAESYIHYDNLKLYANAKQTQTLNIVTKQDHKILNKFCKRWIQQKGVINPKDIRRIQSTIKFYRIKQHNKLYNASQKEFRLARKTMTLTKTV